MNQEGISIKKEGIAIKKEGIAMNQEDISNNSTQYVTPLNPTLDISFDKVSGTDTSISLDLSICIDPVLNDLKLYFLNNSVFKSFIDVFPKFINLNLINLIQIDFSENNLIFF